MTPGITDAARLPLRVVPATIEDRSVIREILEEAQSWLATKGIAQWTMPFDDAWLTPRIESGEFYVACLANEPVAAVRLLWADPLFWGEWERGDAAYLHSLAVRRAYAGQRLGARVVHWAAEEARAHGRSFLRLDCLAENRRLGDYYRDLGFAALGPATVGGATMMLFEKDLIGQRHEGEDS
jgi:GNAT superfamily N-acetyltransferase